VLIAWLVLAAVLLLVELRHLALFALFVAAGCLGAAVVALVAPSAILLQVLVAVVIATAGIVVLRPKLAPALQRRAVGDAPTRGVHGGIIGSEVVTLDLVGDPLRPGHVRLGGERWLAVSTHGVRIPAGTRALVTAIEGTTLVVWPLEDGSPALPETNNGSKGESS
jgi:membrane protein implicated in regulation of membrane protease activity